MSESAGVSAATRLRVPTLDVARLLAAACVVLFHFGFHGGTHHNLDFYQPSLAAWTRYGYLGVNVFFVISGFVIAWSAEGAKALDFAWRRWLRVYPTFIFCVCLTSLVVVVARDPHFSVTARQLLAHLIVDPRRFRIPFIDDVYWTIVSECQFYAFVALGLSVPWLRKRQTACIWAWFLLTLVNEYGLDLRPLRFALVSQWSSFFILGMMVFRLKTKAFKPLDAALAVAAFGVGLHLELRDAIVRFRVAPDYSPLVVGSVLTGSILLLVLSTRWRFRPAVEKELRRLGAISYPLYLLHGTIGYILINRLAPRLGLLGAIAVTVVLVLALASFVAFAVEPRLKAACTGLVLRAPSWLSLRPSPQALPTTVLSAPAESGLTVLEGQRTSGKPGS